MSLLVRWFAPAALAAALGAGALFPSPARASDDLIRVIVDVADIAFRSGQPYYRHGNYGHHDRLIVDRDHRGRPVYYRYTPRHDGYGGYDDGRGRGNGYYGHNGFVRDPYGRYSRQRCDSRGRCQVEYYDPRYDRDGRYDRRSRDYGYDNRGRHDRYWDGRRWRDRY